MHDRDVLRRLVETQAKIAALPVHKEKAEMWRKLNQLEAVRPMVWINEICWNEMNVDGELTLQTNDTRAQQIETGLRQLIYQWKHLPADMIVDNYLTCPLVIHNTGFGLVEDVDIVKTDETSGVVSRRFHSQITNPEDIQKIKMPRVTCERAASEENYQRMTAMLGDILPVKQVGIKGSWFAPWDELIRWWGVEEAMLDLTERPEMVSAIYSRLVDAYVCQLDQWEALNLLSLNNDNTRVGSGGYAYTNELPAPGFDPHHIRAKDLWGSSTAQIFGSVSPKMHWEFALQYEMRWLERWGLTYYGCCEPLDAKMGILKRIPNLRKVSMSPWIDIDRAVKTVGTDYVMSRKPNPAVVAADDWCPEVARQQLAEFLEKTRGGHIEIILKDISTVRYQPQRLWEWEKITMEMARKYGT